LGAKKTIFGLRYGFPDFTFLFLVELGTCVQNLIFTKVVEGCQKNKIPQRGMLKFTYKGRFFTFKVSSLGKFWQILAVLGSFGQIWAEFAAFTVAESMPELGLKSSNPHNF
jgi:hypothetical protein